MVEACKPKHVQNNIHCVKNCDFEANLSSIRKDPSFDPRVFENPNVRNKRIGAPEAKGHFEFQMHNIKLKDLKHILVFIPREKSLKIGQS